MKLSAREREMEGPDGCIGFGVWNLVRKGERGLFNEPIRQWLHHEMGLCAILYYCYLQHLFNRIQLFNLSMLRLIFTQHFLTGQLE